MAYRGTGALKGRCARCRPPRAASLKKCLALRRQLFCGNRQHHAAWTSRAGPREEGCAEGAESCTASRRSCPARPTDDQPARLVFRDGPLLHFVQRGLALRSVRRLTARFARLTRLMRFLALNEPGPTASYHTWIRQSKVKRKQFGLRKRSVIVPSISPGSNEPPET